MTERLPDSDEHLGRRLAAELPRYTAPASLRIAIVQATEPAPSQALAHPCPCCGGRMIIIETFEAGAMPRTRPSTTSNAIRIDTS